jgi:hypothetical protein
MSTSPASATKPLTYLISFTDELLGYFNEFTKFVRHGGGGSSWGGWVVTMPACDRRSHGIFDTSTYENFAPTEPYVVLGRRGKWLTSTTAP